MRSTRTPLLRSGKSEKRPVAPQLVSFLVLRWSQCFPPLPRQQGDNRKQKNRDPDNRIHTDRRTAERRDPGEKFQARGHFTFNIDQLTSRVDSFVLRCVGAETSLP